MSSRLIMKNLVFAIKMIHRLQVGQVDGKEVVAAFQRMIDDGTIDTFAKSVMLAEKFVQTRQCTPKGQPKSGIVLVDASGKEIR